MACMPWKETDVMKERVKFILEWERRCLDAAPYRMSLHNAAAREKLREIGYVK